MATIKRGFRLVRSGIIEEETVVEMERVREREGEVSSVVAVALSKHQGRCRRLSDHLHLTTKATVTSDLCLCLLLSTYFSVSLEGTLKGVLDLSHCL